MGKLANAMVAVSIMLSGVAHAGGRHERWKAVQDLAPGVLVEVESKQQAEPEDCRVVSADDSALTCQREPDPNADWGPGSGARVVFPRDAVGAVWVWEYGNDRRFWIKVGAGFAVGALLCSQIGPGPAFICAGVGALIAACLALDDLPVNRGPFSGPVALPRPPRPLPTLERKLWYRAPAGGAVSP